jgi:hypothetical protein
MKLLESLNGLQLPAFGSAIRFLGAAESSGRRRTDRPLVRRSSLLGRSCGSGTQLARALG